MSAAPILTIQWLRWPEDLHVGHYAENWREIERWANAARCPTATPDWSQVSFRTPHPQWTTWQDAETNYLEFQRFASALAKLGTASTCPSLFIPYKQWAKPNWPAWDTREEEANLLEIVRWANAMPGCCGGCVVPTITAGSSDGASPITLVTLDGDHLTPVVSITIDGTPALGWVEVSSLQVTVTWDDVDVYPGATVVLTTACGSSSYEFPPG